MNDRMLWEKLQSEYYAEWAEMFGYEIAQTAINSEGPPPFQNRPADLSLTNRLPALERSDQKPAVFL